MSNHTEAAPRTSPAQVAPFDGRVERASAACDKTEQGLLTSLTSWLTTGQPSRAAFRKK